MHSATAKKHGSTDLAEGNIASRIVLFALPLLLGQIFQNLYNSVDSIVVGNFVGVTALAAVTSCTDISRLLIGFFTGLSVGAGVSFSMYFGAKKYDRLHRCIHTALTFSVIVGVLMMTVGIVISPQLLMMVKCPADVFPEALLYLRIYLIGILFTSLYNVQAGVLRSVGDSRSPFLYLVAASLTNIALDLLFVAVLKMGVAGVAIATIISQLESVLLVTTKMLRTDDVYQLVPSHLKIEKQYLVEIIRYGIPSAIQSGLISFSNLFYQRYVNGFGSTIMAGSGVGRKIDSYVGLVSLSLGQASTTFVSQCVGAGKTERAFKGIRFCLAINLAIIVAIAVPIYIYAAPVARIFTSDPTTLSYAVLMIRILLPAYFLQAFMQVFSNAVRGFGRPVTAMLSMVGGLIVCRQIYLAVVMRFWPEVRFVFAGWPVGWGFGFVLNFIAYMVLVRIPYNRRKAAAAAEVAGMAGTEAVPAAEAAAGKEG